MSKILKFAFQVGTGPEEIESDMALAIFAAECLHGRPRVRLETRYLVGQGGQTCVMEVSGSAGESVAQVFAGLASARFGEEAVNISHFEERQLEVLNNGA
jgi:hypothetical protein